MLGDCWRSRGLLPGSGALILSVIPRPCSLEHLVVLHKVIFEGTT